MNARTRCAPLCASIFGALALLCLEAPAGVLGRDAHDEAAQATSGAHRSEIRKAAGQAGASRRGELTQGAHGRRPFTRSPGRQARPARAVAPGHLRPRGDPSPGVPQPPTGEVLGATPPPAPKAAPAAPSRPDGARMSEPRAAPFLRDGQPALPAAIARGPQRAGALGGVLGVTASVSRIDDVAMPALPNRFGTALLLIVLGSQVVAASLLTSAVRRILGGSAPPRPG